MIIILLGLIRKRQMKKTVMIVKNAKMSYDLEGVCAKFLGGNKQRALVINLHGYNGLQPEVEFKQLRISRPITRRVKEYLIG